MPSFTRVSKTSKRWETFCRWISGCQPLRMQFEDAAVPSMASGGAGSLGAAGSVAPLAQCSLVWKPKGDKLDFPKTFS